MLGDFRRPYLRGSSTQRAARSSAVVAGLDVLLGVTDVASSQLGAIVVATLVGAVAASCWTSASHRYGLAPRNERPAKRSDHRARGACRGAALRTASWFSSRSHTTSSRHGHCAVLRSGPSGATPLRAPTGAAQLTEGLSSANDGSRARTSRSPRPSSRHWTHETGTRLATRRQSRSIRSDIAARMGLSGADQQTPTLAGLVHDIGKIGLPAGLLEKEGPLTLEERRDMQGHSEIGERILAKVDDYGEIAASSVTITNASTATAIRTDSRATKSRFSRGSSRSRMRTTR